MTMKKQFLMIVCILLLALQGGCNTEGGKGEAGAGSRTEAEKEVTIKVLQNKVEIADVLKRMEVDYQKENPGVRLRFETFGGGVDYDRGLVAKFQSGDAPDVFINEGHAKLMPWLEKVEDLSDQPWTGDMIEGAGTPVTRNGRLYGMPGAVEGFGFAYNKSLFARAGIKVLPNTLKTLEEACARLQEAGIQPFSNSYAEWWVLGMHNFSIPLSHEAYPQRFIDGIASGKAKFQDGTAAGGWIRLLELTVKYGQKDPTATGDYASSVAAFAAGKAAMIQQGNWIQPNLDKVDPDLEVGFLPIPLGDVPETKVNAGIPNYWLINRESRVKAEAKAWLNWMVSSERGRRYIAEDLKFIPAFKSIRPAKLSGLNAALFEYISTGNTYGWEFPRLPPGATEIIGPEIMEYLSGRSTAPQLFEAIDRAIIEKSGNNYW